LLSQPLLDTLPCRPRGGTADGREVTPAVKDL
jgi:hypothetical protein